MDQQWQDLLTRLASSFTPDKAAEAWKGFSQLGSSPPKTPDRLPAGSYTNWVDAARKPGLEAGSPQSFAQQIYPNAKDAGFNIPPSAYNMLAKIRQSPTTNPDAVYPPKPPPGKPDDRLAYEDLTPSPQSRKGGREDMQPQGQAGGQQPATPATMQSIISPEIRSMVRDMVKKDPSLLQRPWVLGKIVEKMIPFMHKVHQEQYQQQREAHTRFMEAAKLRSEDRSNDRADRAQRLEEYRVWKDQERDITARADKAFNRMLKMADPMTTVEGDRAAAVKRYRDEYEAAEEERKRLVSGNPYLRGSSGGAGVQTSGPGSSYGKGAQAKAAPESQEFDQTKTQYDKAMAKSGAALGKAGSQDERNTILRNTIAFANSAREEVGLPPLTEEEVGGLVQSLPQYDTTTYGQMASNWFSEKMKQYLPTAHQFMLDMRAGHADATEGEEPIKSPWYAKDPLDPMNLVKALNPASLQTQFSKGLQRARGMDPTMKELAQGKSASWPERGLGALGALGAVGAPAAYAAAPWAAAGGQAAGESAYEATGNPWAALAAGGLAGGGLMGRRAAAPAGTPPQGPQGPLALPKPGMPYPPTPPSYEGPRRLPAPGLSYPPTMPQQPQASGAPQLPAPGQTSGPPTHGPGPGLRGQGVYQPPRGPAFEMPGPKPEPQGPAAQAHAAADVLTGQEKAPMRSLRDQGAAARDVSQFGDYAVGDKVSYRGRVRMIEELIPKQAGHLAPKVKLSGLKGPVTMTALEKAKAGTTAAAPSRFSEGMDVQWTPGSADMMRAMGMKVELQAGKIEQIVKLRSGDIARVRKPDGSLAEVRLRDLAPRDKP